MKHNNVTANNRACPPAMRAPPMSGVGIAVLVGKDVGLIDNGVFGNESTAAVGSAIAAGSW